MKNRVKVGVSVNGGVQAVTKITKQSKAFLQASNNLALESIVLEDDVVLKALAVVNEGVEITPLIIKEVVKRGQI
jgi:hypothetical protein